MQKEDYVAQFAILSPEQKARMLLLLSFELSLVGRDIFGPSEARNPATLASSVTAIRARAYSDAEKVMVARGLTEMHHQISGHLLKMERPEGRYPDNVLIGILLDIAEAHGMGASYSHRWQEAYSTLQSG